MEEIMNPLGARAGLGEGLGTGLGEGLGAGLGEGLGAGLGAGGVSSEIEPFLRDRFAIAILKTFKPHLRTELADPLSNRGFTRVEVINHPNDINTKVIKCFREKEGGGTSRSPRHFDLKTGEEVRLKRPPRQGGKSNKFDFSPLENRFESLNKLFDSGGEKKIINFMNSLDDEGNIQFAKLIPHLDDEGVNKLGVLIKYLDGKGAEQFAKLIASLDGKGAEQFAKLIASLDDQGAEQFAKLITSSDEDNLVRISEIINSSSDSVSLNNYFNKLLGTLDSNHAYKLPSKLKDKASVGTITGTSLDTFFMYPSEDHAVGTAAILLHIPSQFFTDLTRLEFKINGESPTGILSETKKRDFDHISDENKIKIINSLKEQINVSEEELVKICKFANQVATGSILKEIAKIAFGLEDKMCSVPSGYTGAGGVEVKKSKDNPFTVNVDSQKKTVELTIDWSLVSAVDNSINDDHFGTGVVVDKFKTTTTISFKEANAKGVTIIE